MINDNTMTHGKNICKQLKEVRKRIAEENDIPLEIEECTYKGECRGTCLRCETEVRYLENALADRLRLGKVATVAGLALGLATTTAQAKTETPQEPVKQTPALEVAKDAVSKMKATLRGTVIDSTTKEPTPFADVIVMKDSIEIARVTTDTDGNFSLRLPYGKYDLSVLFAGYMPLLRRQVKVNVWTKKQLLAMERAALEGIVPVQIVGKPAIEIPEPDAHTRQGEQDGVKVIVQ